jgi:hypothetical protein
MSHPPVSVVIPAHGRPDLLLKTVASVKAQDYTGPMEIIVVDDGSPLDLAGPLREAYPEVRYVRQKNEGSASARQHGTDLAQGPYVAYNDDDDLWEPHKLGMQVAFMEAHPEIDICITDFMKFSADQVYDHTNFRDHNELWKCPHQQISSDPPGYLWEPRAYTPALLMGGPFPPQTTLTRKKFVEQVGGWDRRIAGNGQDIEFGVRATWQGRTAFIDLPLTRVHRRHGTNISANVTRTYVNVVRELAAAARDYPAPLQKFMQQHLGGYYARVAWMLMRDGNFKMAAWHYRRAMAYGKLSPKLLLKYLLCQSRALLQPSAS